MALLASAYVSTILLILGGVLSPFSAVTFLTSPEAWCKSFYSVVYRPSIGANNP
jgi:hypothetical protein